MTTVKPLKLKDIQDPDEFIPTRESLLDRLKDYRDDASWRDFFHTYWKLIYGVALRSGLTETEAQEVVQETVIAVSRHMPDIKYDPKNGSFKGWLLTTTSWRIKDQLRKRLRHAAQPLPAADASADTSLMAAAPEPADESFDGVWEEEWQKNLIDAAIHRVKERVKPKQFQIFDLHVIKDWPLAMVKTPLGVNAAQVYLAKHRVTGLIRKEVKRLETESARQS